MSRGKNEGDDSSGFNRRGPRELRLEKELGGRKARPGHRKNGSVPLVGAKKHFEKVTKKPQGSWKYCCLRCF